MGRALFPLSYSSLPLPYPSTPASTPVKLLHSCSRPIVSFASSFAAQNPLPTGSPTHRALETAT
jgi:hypothetical protein